MQVSDADVLGQVPYPVGVTAGPDHVVEWFNDAAARWLDRMGGWDRTRLIGHPLREVAAGPQLLDLVERLDQAFRTAEPWVGPALPVGGHWLSVGAVPLTHGDGVVGLLLHGVETRGPDQEHRPRAALAMQRGLALQQLAGDLSHAATPSGIGRLAITAAARLLGADAASVYAMGAPGSDTLELVDVTGWPAELAQRYRTLPIQRGGPLSEAVLDRVPVWLEDSEQWRERYPRMAPVHSAGGYQATACLPLRVEERGLGAIVFSFTDPRAFDPDERAYLAAVASLCAQALDRARLFVAEQAARAAAERQRDRMAFLTEANLLLEAPLSVEQRMRQLADLTVPHVADWCSVHLVRDDRVEQIAVAHADPEKVEFVARLTERYPPDPDAPGGAIQVARTGVPVHFRDIPDELLVAAAQDAEHLELIRALGMRSAVVVPLLVRGTSLGALTLVHAESGQRFDDSDVVFVQQLARSAGLALDNARLYEEQRRIAHTLQAALLPARLPDVPGLRLAARYRPQGRERDVRVGGDVYDVFEGPQPGLWAFMIADVCGKGPEAAAITALIRYTVHAEVGHGFAPEEVLRRLNAAMLRQAGADRARFATVVHGRFRVDSGGIDVSLAIAGHVPPVVMRRDGVEPVTAGGTVLGVYPDPELSQVQVRLEPGDALVLCTDGLTEARGPGGLYGEQRLLGRLAGLLGRSAQDVAEVLLADVLAHQDGPLRDDVAILVLESTR